MEGDKKSSKDDGALRDANTQGGERRERISKHQLGGQSPGKQGILQATSGAEGTHPDTGHQGELSASQ